TEETSHLGFSLASGNINGDDMADLVIGALFSSPAGRTQSGEGFVFWGRPSINGSIAFQADKSDVDIWGAAPGHSLGSAVAIGDLNADGRDDIIISAEDAPPAGRVYVFSGDKITRVEDRPANSVVPQAFHLHQNYPNPFNAGTAISLEVPANAGSFEVSVYNLNGQLVTRLFEGTAPPGLLELRWEGRDAVGRSVGSGVYFYALKSGESFSIQRKLLLLK
ncbi:MAG: FlgD immunoglobulin-like domain containing protein, partial [bacterium]